MSLIPFILDLADELHEFSRCLANGIDINDFGFGLYTGTDQQQQQQPQQQQSQQQQPSSQQQQSPRRNRTSSFSSFWIPSKRHHPYNRIKSACCGKSVGEESGVATSPEKDASPTGTPGKTASYSVVNKNGFQVSMNVKQFAPSELSVKTIDNCIVVEGRHDDKEDGHGVISRHFVRKYMLPKGYDPKDVLSTLSSDGILTVKAPPPPPPSVKNDERNERIVEIQPTIGPTQVVPVVSAKEAQSKEQAKKLSSPATHDECQLPEKRQKLDIPQEQQESTEAQPTSNNTPTPPSPPELNDFENEKAEEPVVAENEKQTQKEAQEEVGNVASDAHESEEQDDKKLEEKNVMEIDETEKTVENDKKSIESNGDTNNLTDNLEENEPVPDSCPATAPKDDVPAEKPSEVDMNTSKSTSKMEVDGDDYVAATANNSDEATEEVEEEVAEGDAIPDGKSNAIETNNTTPSKVVEHGDKENISASTGELPADAPKSAVIAEAESAIDDAAAVVETAVLPTDADNDIDDVALLKAAVTADADITSAEENALLSEPMDGITTTNSPPGVDTVECSLFAKTPHLGNGNTTTLVAAEEVAN